MGVFDKWKGRSLAQFDLQKLRRHFLPYSVLVAALFAMTFFGVCVPDSGPRGLKGPAAYIQDDFISFREFRWVYENMLASTRERMGDDFDAENNAVAQQVLSQLVSAEVSYYLATELGLSVSDAAVVEYIKEQSYFHNERGQYDNALVRRAIDFWGITADIYKDGVKRDLTLAKLQELTSQAYFRPSSLDKWRAVAHGSHLNLEYIVIDPAQLSLDISEDELASYLADPQVKAELEQQYQRNIQLYQRPESRKARQILIAYADARRALGVSRSMSEAAELARTVRDSLREQPDEFAALVEQYSDDQATKASGGDMGLLTQADIVPELAEPIAALKPGQISAVLSSPFGFHIIQLTEVKAPVNQSFAEVMPALARASWLQSHTTKEARSVAQQVLRSLVQQPAEAVVPSEVSQVGEAKPAAEPAPPSLSFAQLQRQYQLSWQTVAEVDFLTSAVAELGDVPDLKLALLSLVNEQPSLSHVVVDQVFDVQGKHYILRVKDVTLTPADAAASDEAKMISSLDSLYENMAQIDTFYRFQSLVSYYQQQWESERKIRINQDYLGLGQTGS